MSDNEVGEEGKGQKEKVAFDMWRGKRKEKFYEKNAFKYFDSPDI